MAAQCTICEKEFTKEDMDTMNWREEWGNEYYHRMCPGTACTVCGEPIEGPSNAEVTPANVGTGWKHKGCTYSLELKPMETECDAASWIVK